MKLSLHTLLGFRLFYFALIWLVFLAGYVLQHDQSFVEAAHSVSSYSGEKIYDWKFAQYLITYQDNGFIRRGLVASLLWFISSPYWLAATILWNIAVLGLLAWVVSEFLKFSNNTLSRHSHRLLACILLISPATAINAGFDFGRYDWVNINLIIGSLFLLRTDYKWLIAPLSCVGLLIHGAFLFYGIPCVLLSVLATYTWRQIRGLFLSILAACGVTVLVLALFGQYDGNLESLRNLTQLYGVHSAPLKVWLRSGGDNISMVIGHWSRGLYNWFDIFSYIVFLCATTLLLLKAIGSSQSWRKSLIFLAPIFIMPLYILGIDYARWVMLYVCISLIAIAYGLIDDPSLPIFDDKISSVAGIVLSLGFLGPIGTVHAFPAIQFLATAFPM